MCTLLSCILFWQKKTEFPAAGFSIPPETHWVTQPCTSLSFTAVASLRDRWAPSCRHHSEANGIALCHVMPCHAMSCHGLREIPLGDIHRQLLSGWRTKSKLAVEEAFGYLKDSHSWWLNLSDALAQLQSKLISWIPDAKNRSPNFNTENKALDPSL